MGTAQVMGIITGVLAIIAGIIIIVRPQLLNRVVSLSFIVIGVLAIITAVTLG
jgi:hypothetical protein